MPRISAPAPKAVLSVLAALAVAAVGAAGRGPTSVGSIPAPRAALPATPRSVSLGGRAPRCPLPAEAQVRSYKAFEKMMPVFRHARCANCHGGVNPYKPEAVGGHGGGEEDPAEGIAACQECHGRLPHWDVPGPPMFFTGKDTEDLCMQVKKFDQTGASFIDHIQRDHGNIQFIAAGFAGLRALDNATLASEQIVAEQPPGTQADLTQKARDWVAAMGGDFVGDPECGCVVGVKVEIILSGDVGQFAGMCPGLGGTDKFTGTLFPMAGGGAADDDLLYRGLLSRTTNVGACGTRPAPTVDQVAMCSANLTGTAQMNVEVKVQYDDRGAYFKMKAAPGYAVTENAGGCQEPADWLREYYPDGASGFPISGVPSGPLKKGTWTEEGATLTVIRE
jgi:hypothetical protein